MRGGWFGGCLKMALAAGFGASLVMAANNVSVTQQGAHTLVDVSYVRPIELAPSFTYPWKFSVHVDVISLSLK